MLILTRRRGKTIHFGDDIVLTLLEVRGERIRVGVRAPRNISIDRLENRGEGLPPHAPVSGVGVGQLVLTRHLGQSFVIGGEITVEILRVSSRGMVAFGINAPRHVPVDRGEIFERKQAGLPYPATNDNADENFNDDADGNRSAGVKVAYRKRAALAGE